MALDRAILFRLATSTQFERAVRSLPGGERAAWRAATRYIAGTTAADAFQVAHRLDADGVASSVDQFGEGVHDAATADAVAAEYVRLAKGLVNQPSSVWLAVDLTHLGLDVDDFRCTEHLAEIADALPPGRRIQVGAEDHAHADAAFSCVLAAAGSGLADRLGATVQANLRRSPGDATRLAEAGVHVRLVKGAYLERSDIAHPFGEPTDVAYLRLAHRLAAERAEFSLATHDEVLREAMLTSLGPLPVEQLLGVRPDMVDDMVARGVPVRVYVPFGVDWFRYWMRRVAESRGA